MAKICPFTNEPVLYLDCADCDDKRYCRKDNNMTENPIITPLVRVKKLSATATIPTRGSAEAAGYDLYADTDTDITIEPGQTVKIETNIAMEIPRGYFGAIYARSGIATKRGLRPANCVGVVDSDYRGNVIVAIHNDSNAAFPQIIPAHSRVAQLVIQPYLAVDFVETDKLDTTDRGTGGFGSTGGV